MTKGQAFAALPNQNSARRGASWGVADCNSHLDKRSHSGCVCVFGSFVSTGSAESEFWFFYQLFYVWSKHGKSLSRHHCRCGVIYNYNHF